MASGTPCCDRTCVSRTVARGSTTSDFRSPTLAVVLRRNDHYLLIRQYRFIIDEYVWAIPSGGAEPGEALDTRLAAKRSRRRSTQQCGLST